MKIQYLKNADEKNLLIKATGDCDMYSSHDFFTGITAKLTDGCSKAVLDLNEVTYLDSSGVGAIIRIIRLAKEKQIILTFRGIKGTPRKVLDMSNILSLIVEEP